MEQRQPELNDARARLQAAAQDRGDAKRMLAAVQRVVSYMTMGVDMSALFAEMAIACNTRDLSQKRLVYMYLCSYAGRNQELALLTVNTLHKDCTDASPVVRGMALRALGSLRAASLVEYLWPLVQRGVADPNSYVRRTAAMAAAKLYFLAPHLFAEGSAGLAALREMALSDPDALAALNAACALLEMGVQPQRDAVLRLLSRLRDLNDWNQCQVLEMASAIRGIPQSEVIDLMNFLDDKLQHSNSAVVMATAKVFLQLTEPFPEIHRQVYVRVKTPLLLLVDSAESPEIVYPLLQHLKLCLTRFPDLLDDDARHFFVRASDPAWLRLLKIDILTLLASNTNATVVLDELCVYVSDVEPTCARRAMDAIGKIGIKLPSMLSEVATRLANLVTGDSDDGVTAASVLVIKDLLRKYPAVAPDVVPTVVERALATGALDDDPDSKAAAVWVLGEFGIATCEGSAYCLDATVDAWHELHTTVKLAVLSAAVKMFFASPAEARPVLGRVLEFATSEDESSPDVRDRAWLYYRALHEDLGMARSVIAAGAPPVVGAFAEDEGIAAQDGLFREFNSLAVLYGTPSSTFVKAETRSGTVVPAPEQQQQQQQQPQQQQQQQRPVREELIVLRHGAVMAPAEFQKAWGSLGAGTRMEMQMERGAEEIVSAFKSNTLGIACVASGIVRDTAKVYAYAQEESSRVFVLVEILGTISAKSIVATVKSSDESLAGKFLSLITASLLRPQPAAAPALVPLTLL